MDPIVLLIAGWAEVPARLLAVHASDSSGRCRGCTRGGTGIPCEPWPCRIAWYARQARDVQLGHADSDPDGAG